MASGRDIYERLRAPAPTPPDELCSCPAGTPVKLMSTGGLGFNPLHCLDCNGEVEPERLALPAELAESVANWLFTYGAIDALELASGDYEQWARGELQNPSSPPNLQGLDLTRQLNELTPAYFWLWQPESDDDWQPPSACLLCGAALARYDGGIFPQLLCEKDRVVIVGR